MKIVLRYHTGQRIKWLSDEHWHVGTIATVASDRLQVDEDNGGRVFVPLPIPLLPSET